MKNTISKLLCGLSFTAFLFVYFYLLLFDKNQVIAKTILLQLAIIVMVVDIALLWLPNYLKQFHIGIQIILPLMYNSVAIYATCTYFINTL